MCRAGIPESYLVQHLCFKSSSKHPKGSNGRKALPPDRQQAFQISQLPESPPPGTNGKHAKVFARPGASFQDKQQASQIPNCRKALLPDQQQASIFFLNCRKLRPGGKSKHPKVLTCQAAWFPDQPQASSIFSFPKPPPLDQRQASQIRKLPNSQALRPTASISES